ncbi:MAG: response regulator [Ignavibacteriae bacterium]|nr:response regulator [Ignavibacteriota bacterium]
MKTMKNEKKKKYEILIVEDSPTQSLKLKQLLEDTKYKVRLATNGSDALVQVKEKIPDLIISDIMMPIMDGYEMSKALKSEIRYQGLPVILITSLSESEDILVSLECGADMFISKPYDDNYLLHQVQLILSNQTEIHGIENGEGFELTYYNKKYKIKKDFYRIVNLLLNTYETAVGKNRELIDAQNELIRLNNNLEELVSQRTSALLDEIAERKIIEKELRKSEEKYRMLLNTLQEGIWVVDNEENTTFVNEILPSMLGYTTREMMGKSLYYFMDDGWKEIAKKQMFNRKQGVFEQIEFEFLKKDGTKIQALLEAGPMYDDKGNYIGAIAGVIDISDRMRHEEQLKNLNTVLKAIRNINQLIVREKDKGELIRKACELLIETGSFSNSIISLIDESMNLVDFTCSGDVPNPGLIVESLKSGNLPLCYQDAIKNPNKITAKHPFTDCRDCDLFNCNKINGIKSLTSTLSFEGKIYGFITISVFEFFIDIEEGFRVIEEVVGDISYSLYTFDINEKRKKAEEFITWQEKYFENLLEYANVWLDAIDNEGKLIFWNKKAEEISGYNRDTLLGNLKKWNLMYPDKNKGAELLEFCKDLIKERKTIKYVETEITTATGEKRIISWSSNLIYDENENISGNMFVGDDITERKKAELELIDAKERAEEMNKLKSSFLANMSHELRTPMNGILGFSEILQLEDKVDVIKDIATVINKSGKRLMNTLNSILNLSRVEAGELKPEKNFVNIIDVVFSTVELFKIEAMKKDIELTMESEFDTLLLRTDERMLADVVNNLVNNAVKFTPEGRVSIKVLKEKSDRNEYVIINVTDTGIGINENDYNTIFDEFRQVSEGLSRSFEGTGLGLTICRKYIQLLGGTISVKSKPNEGSTFTVRLPHEFEKPSEINPAVHIEEKSLLKIQKEIIHTSKPRILYVEDDDISVILLVKLLKGKYEIDIATKANEAIEKTRIVQYNLILMDINLGKGESGIDVTREIRKLENYKNIPIIAITAFAMHGDKEEFISGGCDDYLSKPYNPNDLINMIEKYINIK